MLAFFQQLDERWYIRKRLMIVHRRTMLDQLTRRDLIFIMTMLLLFGMACYRNYLPPPFNWRTFQGWTLNKLVAIYEANGKVPVAGWVVEIPILTSLWVVSTLLLGGTIAVSALQAVFLLNTLSLRKWEIDSDIAYVARKDRMEERQQQQQQQRNGVSHNPDLMLRPTPNPAIKKRQSKRKKAQHKAC